MTRCSLSRCCMGLWSYSSSKWRPNRYWRKWAIAKWWLVPLCPPVSSTFQQILRSMKHMQWATLTHSLLCETKQLWGQRGKHRIRGEAPSFCHSEPGVTIKRPVIWLCWKLAAVLDLHASDSPFTEDNTAVLTWLTDSVGIWRRSSVEWGMFSVGAGAFCIASTFEWVSWSPCNQITLPQVFHQW